MPKDLRERDYYRSPPLSNASLPYGNVSRSMGSGYYEPLPGAVHPGYQYSNGGPVQPVQSIQQSLPPIPSQNYASMAAPVSLRPSSGAWNATDDQTLMNARKQGMNWAPIQAAFFPTKTPNACRKRHERLMERKSNEDWDIRKIEELAKHYMDSRKEIWTPLAALAGEKWNVVEQKCMSSGLKNLQTAARAFSRREKGPGGAVMDGNPFPHQQGYSVHDPHSREDSGISFDVEPDYDNDGNSEVSSEQHHHQQQPQQQQQHQHYYQTHDDGQSDGGRHPAYAAYGGRDEQYVPHTRLPSMDMGIDAIINRPGGL